MGERKRLQADEVKVRAFIEEIMDLADERDYDHEIIYSAVMMIAQTLEEQTGIRALPEADA